MNAANIPPDRTAMKSEGDVNWSPHRLAWSEGQIGAEAREWLERDEAVFLHQALSTPCLNVLGKCEGAWIEDLQGRRWLDFHGNNVHQVGFAHPRIVEAITRQLHELTFCTRRYTNKTAVLLAERLAALAPRPLQRVLFSPGGTSAMGMALKLARAATGRHKTISHWDSFHGASLDAISIGGESIFRQGIGPLLPGCEHAPPPDPQQCPFKCGDRCNLNCADYIEYMLEKEGDVAAVIAETVRCTPFIPPKDYWRRIRAACDRHGALLILDEVPICLGRTGRWFAFEHFGIVPDMVVLGKGLGGGVFPLAALLAREDLNQAMHHQALGHYTHEKSPMACAAALATLDVIEEEKLLENSTKQGAYALEQLAALRGKHPIISEVRGLGLLLGLVLARNGRKAADEAERVMYASLRRGLNFKVTMGNILTLTPALTLQRPEMDLALQILDQSLAELSIH